MPVPKIAKAESIVEKISYLEEFWHATILENWIHI